MYFNNYKLTKAILKKCAKKITNEKLNIDLEININKKNFYESKICINIFEKMKKEYGIYNDLTILAIFENLKSNLEEFEIFDNIKFENNNICFEPNNDFFIYLVYKNFYYEFFENGNKKIFYQKFYEKENIQNLKEDNFNDENKENLFKNNEILEKENNEYFFGEIENFDFLENKEEINFFKKAKNFEKKNTKILKETLEKSEKIYYYGENKNIIKNRYLNFFKNLICEKKNKNEIKIIKNNDFDNTIILLKKIMNEKKIDFEFFQKKDKLFMQFNNKEKVLIFQKNQFSEFSRILLNFYENDFQDENIIFITFSDFEKTIYFLKKIIDFKFINIGDVFFEDELILDTFKKKLKFVFFLIFFFDLESTKFFDKNIFHDLKIDLDFKKLDQKKLSYPNKKNFSFYYEKEIFINLLKSQMNYEKFFLEKKEKDLKNFFLLIIETLKIYQNIQDKSYLDEIIFKKIIRIFENI